MVEALLKQSDVLNAAAVATLPFTHPARLFLDSLSEACASKCTPGQVIPAASHVARPAMHAQPCRVEGVLAMRQPFRIIHVPEQVLRVPLPRTPSPVNVSPQRRMELDSHSTRQAPLQR